MFPNGSQVSHEVTNTHKDVEKEKRGWIARGELGRCYELEFLISFSFSFTFLFYFPYKEAARYDSN